MPIRTQRGRAAVYRTLWGWPVRSPKHLVGTVLVLAAVGGGLALVLPEDRSGPATAVPPNRAWVNQFDPASRSPLSGSDRDAPEAPSTMAAVPPDPAPAAAMLVAKSWTEEFLTGPHAVSQGQWIEQLRPYTTEELLPVLQTVDPANVPDAQIIGEPRTVSSGAGKVEVDVPTSAVVVRLLLVPTPQGWRVASFEQVG